jgi:hypothetical protein
MVWIPSAVHAEMTVKDDDNFWSSTGSPHNVGEEFILYKLKGPFCAVRAVQVQVYRAAFQGGYGSEASLTSVAFSSLLRWCTSIMFRVCFCASALQRYSYAVAMLMPLGTAREHCRPADLYTVQGSSLSRAGSCD